MCRPARLPGYNALVVPITTEDSGSRGGQFTLSLYRQRIGPRYIETFILVSVSVGVMFMGVTLMHIVNVAGLVSVVLMGVTLVQVVGVIIRVVFMGVTLVQVMNVARFIPVMFVVVAFVYVMLLHWFLLPKQCFVRLASSQYREALNGACRI